jgi:histidyl-tRNA synthetase
MKDYHTKTEALHVKLLEQMGFEVINPSGPIFDAEVKRMKRDGKTSTQIMNYFIEVVEECDHLAFSTTKKNTVSAGVAEEIKAMKKKGGTVIQLPDLKKIKKMSIADTVSHIRSN